LTEAKIPLTQAQTKKAQRPAKPSRPSSANQSVKNQRAMEMAREVFEKTKKALYDATQRGDQTQMTSLRRRLQTLATSLAAKYPQLEVGGLDSGWPYQKPRDQQSQVGHGGQQTQGDNEITLQELQEVAKRKGISLEEAKKMAQGEGLTIRE
jgi:hypothetical protein